MESFSGQALNNQDVRIADSLDPLGFKDINTPDATTTVTIRDAVTGNPLSSIFSDNLAVPTVLSNPFNTSSEGKYVFFAKNGLYNIVINEGTITEVTLSDVSIFDQLDLPTTLEVINGNRATKTGDIIEVIGFTSSGDGGSAEWQATGNTISFSQTPLQTGGGTISNSIGDEFKLIAKSSIQMEVFGAKPGDVLFDNGPIFNVGMAYATGNSVAELFVGDGIYTVLTTIKHHPSVTIRGSGRGYSILKGDRTQTGIRNAQATFNDNAGRLVSNNTGTFYCTIEDLSISNFAIGLHWGEGWFYKIVSAEITDCIIGQKLGIGTSNVTGCYWCSTQGVKYIDNDTALLITDFTNFNYFTNCRFEGSTIISVKFEEPTPSLSIGMETNSFVTCEFAGDNGIDLAATIYGLLFETCYFETSNATITDENNSFNIRKIIIKDCGIFGGSSLDHKMKLGFGTGVTTHTTLSNNTSNVGRDASAPNPLFIVDMGANGFWTNLDDSYFQNGVGVEDIRAANADKLGFQLKTVDQKSKSYNELLDNITCLNTTELSSVDYITDDPRVAFGSTSGASIFRLTTDSFDVFDSTWLTIGTLNQHAIAFAFAFSFVRITLSGRDVTTNNVAGWFLEVTIKGNQTTITHVEQRNIKDGSVNFVPEFRTVTTSGDVALQVRQTGSNTVDKLSVTLEVMLSGQSLDLPT